MKAFLPGSLSDGLAMHVLPAIFNQALILRDFLISSQESLAGRDALSKPISR
jgi:hypothetical protein